MSEPIWVVSPRARVRNAVVLPADTARVQHFDGLLDVLKRSDAPALIAVDHAEHDLRLADAALKLQRDFPSALLVLLYEEPRPESSGRSYEGIDEHVGGIDAWTLELERLLTELRRLRELEWAGKSAPLRQLAGQVEQAAGAQITVLISGESGTGKELVARAMHEQSPRSREPFVAVNTGAIPETLLESELFGHERGAFTGATARREGIFESAQGGTVFLDEIGDMPPATQVKLLRVLESGTYRRLGGTEELQADVRVVSATHRDLLGLEQSGAFRRDLYYRLSAVTLRVTPLRERPGDILALLHRFWRNERSGVRPPVALTADAVRLLWKYAWPGNVRELRNFADASAVAVGGQVLEAEHVQQYVQGQHGESRNLPVPAGVAATGDTDELLLRAVLHLGQEVHELKNLIESRLPAPTGEHDARLRPPAATVADAERNAIETALLQTGGNRREAARRLGIGERTLYRKIKEYGLR